MLKNVVIITVLVASLLTSMPAAYVFAIEEEDSKNKPETKSETTKSDSTITTNQDNPNDVGKPDVSPTPEETNDAKKNTVDNNKQLPKCDGSFQDCTTRNGDTCKAGERGEKCECAPDNSDCQKNPNVNPSTPDKTCDFNPNADKCKPDKDGNCPPGFSHNDKGNCHPSGPCPNGFFRHTDDESGKCFPIHKHDNRRHDNHDTNNSNNNNNNGNPSHVLRCDSIHDSCIGWCSTANIKGTETVFCFTKHECEQFKHEFDGTDCKRVVIHD